MTMYPPSPRLSISLPTVVSGLDGAQTSIISPPRATVQGIVSIKCFHEAKHYSVVGCPTQDVLQAPLCDDWINENNLGVKHAGLTTAQYIFSFQRLRAASYQQTSCAFQILRYQGDLS